MKGRKQFFFEKKNQKTFVHRVPGVASAEAKRPINAGPAARPRSRLIKFFCFFLFTKSSPAFPSRFLA
jgi:hypothetical protein